MHHPCATPKNIPIVSTKFHLLLLRPTSRNPQYSIKLPLYNPWFSLSLSLSLSFSLYFSLFGKQAILHAPTPCVLPQENMNTLARICSENSQITLQSFGENVFGNRWKVKRIFTNFHDSFTTTLGSNFTLLWFLNFLYPNLAVIFVNRREV